MADGKTNQVSLPDHPPSREGGLNILIFEKKKIRRVRDGKLGGGSETRELKGKEPENRSRLLRITSS